MRNTIVELSEAGVSVLDCEHKTPKPQAFGHPYIAIPDIQEGRVNLSGTRLISNTDLAEWTRRTKPRQGDVLVTRRGRVGDTAPIPPNLECAIGQNLVILRSNEANVDQEYLRWAVRSPQWWSEVDRLLNVGAIFSSLNVKDIARIQIPVPPLREQRAIAEVLGALDDKIAVNGLVQQSAIALGAATYQRGLEAGSQAVPLRSIAENVSGKYLAKEQYASDGPYFVYGSNSIMGRHNQALVSSGFAVLAKIGSYCGNLRWSERPAWVNNNASAIVPNESISPWILRHALDGVDMAPHRAGTGQPYIRMESLFASLVEVPLPTVSTSIAPFLRDLSEIEVLAAEESRTLAATRDALLPQLMSGTLRVKSAEKVLEGVL
jgi:type I restriction enzyme S subunit